MSIEQKKNSAGDTEVWYYDVSKVGREARTLLATVGPDGLRQAPRSQSATRTWDINGCTVTEFNEVIDTQPPGPPDPNLVKFLRIPVDRQSEVVTGRLIIHGALLAIDDQNPSTPYFMSEAVVAAVDISVHQQGEIVSVTTIAGTSSLSVSGVYDAEEVQLTIDFGGFVTWDPSNSEAFGYLQMPAGSAIPQGSNIRISDGIIAREFTFDKASSVVTEGEVVQVVINNGMTTEQIAAALVAAILASGLQIAATNYSNYIPLSNTVSDPRYYFGNGAAGNVAITTTIPGMVAGIGYSGMTGGTAVHPGAIFSPRVVVTGTLVRWNALTPRLAIMPVPPLGT